MEVSSPTFGKDKEIKHKKQTPKSYRVLDTENSMMNSQRQKPGSLPSRETLTEDDLEEIKTNN